VFTYFALWSPCCNFAPFIPWPQAPAAGGSPAALQSAMGASAIPQPPSSHGGTGTQPGPQAGPSQQSSQANSGSTKPVGLKQLKHKWIQEHDRQLEEQRQKEEAERKLKVRRPSDL
jgi:hypothetical protein